MDQSTWSWLGLFCYRNSHQKLQKQEKSLSEMAPEEQSALKGRSWALLPNSSAPDHGALVLIHSHLLWVWSARLMLYSMQRINQPHSESRVCLIVCSKANPDGLIPTRYFRWQPKGRNTEDHPCCAYVLTHAHSDSRKDPAAFVNSNSKMDAWSLGEPQWIVGER